MDPDPIFIRDGRVATSVGVTSALDLTLSFVDEDHDPDLARRMARPAGSHRGRRPARDAPCDGSPTGAASHDGDLRQAFLGAYGRTPPEHRRAFRIPARA